MNKIPGWFKTRKATTIFAITALAGGFLFLNQGITGNAILNNRHYFEVFSLIGLLLVLCAVILGVYSIKKK
jgi:hypothetical protein